MVLTQQGLLADRPVGPRPAERARLRRSSRAPRSGKTRAPQDTANSGSRADREQWRAKCVVFRRRPE